MHGELHGVADQICGESALGRVSVTVVNYRAGTEGATERGSEEQITKTYFSTGMRVHHGADLLNEANGVQRSSARNFPSSHFRSSRDPEDVIDQHFEEVFAAALDGLHACRLVHRRGRCFSVEVKPRVPSRGVDFTASIMATEGTPQPRLGRAGGYQWLPRSRVTSPISISTMYIRAGSGGRG